MAKTFIQRQSPVSGEPYLVKRTSGRCKLRYPRVYQVTTWTAFVNEIQERTRLSKIRRVRVILYRDPNSPAYHVARIPALGIKIYCRY
jgi:hypothetical protein